MDVLEKMLSKTYKKHLHAGKVHQEKDCEFKATWVCAAELEVVVAQENKICWQ